MRTLLGRRGIQKTQDIRRGNKGVPRGGQTPLGGDTRHTLEEEGILGEESKIPGVVTHLGIPTPLSSHLLPPSPHPLCALVPLSSLAFGH